MSAFYDLASLVLVPSGYKASKVYAQKPLTTDGQLTFSRASTATRVNASGLIETVASNVPRLDYLNSSCPRLLLEPQRTNLVTYSEQFDNAGWTKNAVTISANTATSPDGYTNADAIVDTATTAEHNIALASAATTTSNSAQTISVFLKSGTQPFAMLRNFGSANQQYFCVVVNLDTGTITKTQAGSATTSTAATITNYGNGWYRVTATCSFASTINFPILNLVNSATPSIGSFGEVTYLGNGTNSVFAWGFQLENASAYASSYVNTLGSAVTRGADAASKTGISSLIGQTEGTLFVEIQLPNPASNGGQVIYAIGASGNRVYIAKESSSLNIFQLATESASGFNFVNTANITTSVVKMAVAYKGGDNAFFVNGTLISSASATANPTGTSQVVLGNVPNPQTNCDIKISQALLFKTRLTNAQLAEITQL